MPDPTPRWQQRIAAARLHPFSLLAPPISWSADGQRGTVLATTTGRAEVYVFDASTIPATLTQLSERPTGTTGGAISRDGKTGYFFDDVSGNESGRWVAVSVDDTSHRATVLPDLDPATPAGLVSTGDGRILVGRLVDAGFELGIVEPDGQGRVGYTCDDYCYVIDANQGGTRVLLAVLHDGDDEHPGARVVDLATGSVVAEHVVVGKKFEPAGFHPLDDTLVLVTEEGTGWDRPTMWNTTSGDYRAVPLSVNGDVSASWYPDGKSLLVTVLHLARHRVYRLELATGTMTPLELPIGAVNRAKAGADGSVHVLGSRSDVSPTLLRVTPDGATPLVTLPGPRPAPAVPARDVFAEGPGGRVHGLLYLPPGVPEPLPAVFVLHGGPTWQDFDAWSDTVATYVDQGYAVVRVNYRGSTGYGAAWRESLRRRCGFIELEDVAAIRAMLEETGVIDPHRVGVTGGSWGGYLTLMALGTQPDRWRCGVALVPLADWFLATEDSPPWVVEADRVIMDGSISDIPEAYREASPSPMWTTWLRRSTSWLARTIRAVRYDKSMPT